MASTRRGPHTRSYRLSEGEGVADGVRRIALGRAAKALEELDGAGAEGEDFAAAVHGARKELKKLRSLLRLVRPQLGKKAYRAESRRYRSAGRLLAGSRDAEVKLATLSSLAEHYPGEFPAAAAPVWARALDRERERLGGSAAGEVAERIERARAEIEEGCERIPNWSLGGDSWDQLGPGLLSSYRRGRGGMKKVREKPSPERVHEWRKRVKDVWYQLRIVRDAHRPLLDPAVDQAHELAELLGDHHDLAVLAEDLASRPEVTQRQDFEALIGRRQEELLEQALALGALFYAEKPKAFGRRIERYWRVWRRRLVI